MNSPDDTRSRLLESAGQVFADKGFETATVREICRGAEVHNIAAINYYFGDKENLYQQAVRVAFKGSVEPMEVPQWPEGTSPAVKLRQFIRGFATELIGDQRKPWHFQLMSRELAQPTSGCVAFVRDFARPHFEALKSILREALPEDVSGERVNLTALSIIGQVIHHRCARTIIVQMVGDEEARGYTAERLAEHIADFSLAAVGLAGANESAKRR
ncbi:MAG: CerR family C-terminal domain-containing protein [Planctomycetota bacterium]|jgi:AcrR family transcriptional regulator